MRRDRLGLVPSPDARHDYLVELRGEPMAGTRLRVRYVPDLTVLDPTAFAAYLPDLAEVGDGLEALALAVLDDLNNQLVPRWVEVAAERDAPLFHRTLVEDRQPQWDNPLLLSRLGP